MPRRPTPRIHRPGGIPEEEFLSILDQNEDKITALLDTRVAGVFAGVSTASETGGAWDLFVQLLAARLVVGGPVQSVIEKTAGDAIAITGLTAPTGGALSRFPIPSELVQQDLADYTRRQASSYLAKRSGLLVQQIDSRTRRGLRHLLTQTELGVDPPKRLLDAVGKLVGLTDHQGKIYLNDLARRGITTEREAVKLFRKHTRRRARLIVETEAGNAANAGIQAGYLSLRDRMGIPVHTDGVFISDTGERSSGPLLHQRCRCSTRLILFAEEYWLEWVTRLVGACPRCIAFDAKLKGFDTAVLQESA